MPRLLYPFRHRHNLTGKWVKARYVAEKYEIAARHGEWEITGPPEIRHVEPEGRQFNPYRVMAHAELMRLQDPAPQINPHREQPPAIDNLERFLVAMFLRRYVTYCARRRRFAQMQAAARLHREVTSCPR